MRTLLPLCASLVIAGCTTMAPPTPGDCGPLTCGGCCDTVSRRCLSGFDAASCGQNGVVCSTCPGGNTCTFGLCTPIGSGGGSGGGTAGGSGGGTAGGSGGGTAGGSGGGTAGGSGGGTAGGSGGGTAGGSGGGTSGGSGGGTAGGSGGGTAGGSGGGTAGGSGGGTAGGSGGGTGGGSSGTCATGCVNPPGARCSNANTRVTASGPGTCINAQCTYAETQTACPYGCVSGTCASPSTCTPNSLRCNGTQIQTCNSNGSAWLFAQNCTGTCTNGLCDAPCTPADVRCSGAQVQTCNSGGTAWQATGNACTQGCLAGACLTDELVVNGTTLQLDGEHHYASRVWVKNGGQIQVPAGHKLTLYAPQITIDISSSITGTASGTSACDAAPDDVTQGIRLIANQVTINGSLSWTGSSCAKDGLVVRAGTIDGPGTVTCSTRSLLLYGAGGVAPGLSASGATKSLMPPVTITSSNYPEGGTYNDDGPPPLFSWSKPASTITGYYYVVSSSSAVPTATSTYIAGEALALATPPSTGRTYVDVVTIDSTGVVGTVPHEFVLNIVGEPPGLSSSTNPTQGTYSTNPTVVMAWTGGNPTLGYYHLFDQYPSSRPTPQTGAFEPTNKNPAQVLIQNVTPGRWWFHMLALDAMGYATKRAAHYEVDIGSVPVTGTIAGTVRDAHDAGIVGATVVVQRGLYTTTTVAGGVYTFNNLIPAGTYEVVAKHQPDAGLQAQALILSVDAGATTEGTFGLVPGSGCPSCSDVCSGLACGEAPSCPVSGSPLGTCEAGVCVQANNVLSLGATTATTAGHSNSYTLWYNSTNYNTGPDVMYEFTAPTSRTYTVSLACIGSCLSSGASLDFYMTTAASAACGGPVSYQSPWWYGGPGTMNATLTAGTKLYIIVDGSSATDSGPFTLTVQ